VILTALGTGTASPEGDRACSGYHLETGGLRLLLDCGPGVVHSMARLGVDWRRVTHLVLTHFHNDHIGDVPMLFFAWKHGMRPARSEPLTVVGPAGTGKLLERMADVFGGHMRDFDFDVTIDEVEPGAERRLGDVVRLRTAKTPHTEESLAYRIEADGRSFCYTGDTGMSRDLASFAQSVDALLIECSVPDDHPMPTHPLAGAGRGHGAHRSAAAAAGDARVPGAGPARAAGTRAARRLARQRRGAEGRLAVRTVICGRAAATSSSRP
jgi:ribonuclease BN (tRNA processing enzyme)